jgi:hypothetical protein
VEAVTVGLFTDVTRALAPRALTPATAAVTTPDQRPSLPAGLAVTDLFLTTEQHLTIILLSYRVFSHRCTTKPAKTQRVPDDTLLRGAADTISFAAAGRALPPADALRKDEA